MSKCLLSNPHNVIDVISSAESTKEIISWLCMFENSPQEGNEFSLRTNLDDSKTNNPNSLSRVAVSFTYLNAIRDSCRYFLDSQSTSSTSALDGPSTPEPKHRRTRGSALDLETPQYSDSFPPLSASVAKTSTPKKLVGRKKKKAPSQSKNNGTVPNGRVQSNRKPIESSQRRRIRPASAKSLQSSPWSNGLNFSPIVAAHGNISSLPSEDVDEMRRNIPAKDLWGAKKSRSPSVKKLTTSGESASHNSPVVVTPPRDVTPRDSSNTRRPEQNKYISSSSRLDINIKNRDDSLNELKIKRLADIYVALLKTYLVPSLALELQLLFRLLSVKDVEDAYVHLDKIENCKQDDNRLKRLFTNGQSCRDFSTNVLVQMKNIILHLGNGMISGLASFPLIVEHLPEIATELSSTINREEKHAIFDESNFGVGLGTGTNTAILTLPFDENRDSRHNFRSQEQAKTYKNREESRDAFLYQLREFQEMRGTFLHSDQIQKYLEGLDVACKKVIQSISPNNFSWFTDIFCDLLLQIGLVPMGETDKDILNHIGDKDRLQKLHRRFTSKGFQSSKSSQKLTLPNKHTNQNNLAATRAETFFTGHQEFFYRFINFVDSHRFNIMLSNRLARLIISLSSIETTRGLEHRIAQLQLLAKFLGMITFSPNWDNGMDGTKNEHRDYETDLINEALPIISIQRFIKDGWQNHRLTVVIPWVVEFLRMSTWDIKSQKSYYYKQTFGLLLSIRKGIKTDERDNNEFCKTTSLFVLFQLETLFSEVVGLVESERLPLYTLPKRKSQKSDVEKDSGFDKLPLCFSKSFLNSSSPHLEGLQKLIIELSSKLQGNGEIATPKKLKPFSVQTDAAISLSLNSLYSPMSKSRDIVQSNFLRSTAQDSSKKKRIFCVKLVDSFFHQNKDIQHICEFVVDLSLKDVVSLLLPDFVIPSLEERFQVYSDEQKMKSTTDLESYLFIVRDLVQGTEKDARIFMYDHFRKFVKSAIEILTPSLNLVEVRNIAISLATTNAIQKGDELLLSLINSEAKKLVDKYCERKKKVLYIQKRELPFQKSRLRQRQSAPRSFVFSKKELFGLNKFWLLLEHDVCESKTINQCCSLSPETKDTMTKVGLRLFDISVTCSEISKNKFWSESSKLARKIAAVLKRCVSIWLIVENDTEVIKQENLANILSSIRILTSLGCLGILTSDMVDIASSFCSGSNINMLIYSKQSSSQNSTTDLASDENFGLEEIFNILIEMVRGRLLQLSIVEDALLRVLDESPLFVTSIQNFFCKVNENNIIEFNRWCKGENLGMPRLQCRMLSMTAS